MTITTIALSKLEPSPVNVRKIGGQSIDDLAANIEAVGLIQNLSVRESAKGKYEVVAGGRRLAALKRLLKEKRNVKGELVTKTFAVPCLILTDEDATEISLAENAIRQAMHPADQFEAFRALAEGEKPMSVGDIAARFGVAERTVEQRLKLARVSPKLLAVYREGKMTLEQLEAFTVSDDARRQEKAWTDASKAHSTHPFHIRRMLTDTKISADSKEGRLIGLEAYLAAGGTITRDLFSERDSTFLDDPELVDRLVKERLDAEAEDVKAEGWSWVRVFPERFDPWQHDLRQIAAPKRPLSPEEAAERQRLLDARDALHERYEDESEFTDEDDAEDTRLVEAVSAIDRIDRTDWSGFDKATAGAAISFDWQGNLTVTRGLVSKDESKTAEQVAEAVALPLGANGRPAKPKAEFSASLLADLSAQRTMAMRAEMASNPTVALDVLIWTLALREFFHGSVDQHCAKISATTHFAGERDLGVCKARDAMAQQREEWKMRLPKKVDNLWCWIGDAESTVKLDLLAYLVATSLDATQANGAPATANSNAIHEALGLDMANYFEPFLPGYLARVTRTQVLEAVEEAVSPEAARALNGCKKAELVAGAEKELAGTGWIPKPLRLPEPDTAANENAADQQEAA